MSDKEYPLDKIHQTVVHQLRHAADEIENGSGIVANFNYDEDPPEVESEMGSPNIKVVGEREVVLELDFLLPE